MSSQYRCKYVCSNGGHEFIVDDCPWCHISQLKEENAELRERVERLESALRLINDRIQSAFQGG